MAVRRGGQDTRRFRRRTVRIMVDYFSDAGVCCDYATTLGAGGLFIQTESPLPAGSLLKMRFRLPGGEEVHEIAGRVVWSNDSPGHRAPGMGIQFTDAVGTARLARDLENLS
ncbi:MAG: PilZ domain-containing protein [Proteobacteria bacterium]|nr:PilZ domain-containing protein [Pseudomonadota bacterium]